MTSAPPSTVMSPVSRPRLSLALLVAGALAAGEVAAWTLQPQRAASAPSLLAVLLGMGALFAGAYAIYRINNSGGRLWGRFGALCMMIIGLGALPAFAYQIARWQKSMEVQEWSNLGAMADACLAYAHRHQGRFPASLAVLVADHRVNPAMLVDPRSGMKPLVLPAGGKHVNWKKIAQSVQRHSDYQYIGADLREPLTVGGKNVAARIMVLFRYDQDFNSGGPIAFANGQVRWEPRNALVPMVKTSNAMRKKLGLPVATFFTNPPEAPAGK